VVGIPTPELGNFLDLHSRILDSRSAQVTNEVLRRRLRKQVCVPKLISSPSECAEAPSKAGGVFCISPLCVLLECCV
jgi:hypothetical protein